MSVIIEARRLRKLYGGSTAVREVSFTVNDGEFLSLLGASGSGKTTLLRMIAGLEQPTSGQVLHSGQDITHLPPAKRNMRMVFQDFALFPNLSVRDNVAFGLRLRINRGRVSEQDIASRVGKYLEIVQLSAHADKLPHQLSGGQKQRVSLARALVTDPPVVLFDEPLGSLDANMRKAMQIELKRLHRDLRKTFIYVTHDQEEAMGLSDRVAVLQDGQLLQLASPEAIYAQPTSVAVAKFFGAANVLTGMPERAADGALMLRLPQGARFAVGAEAGAASVTAALGATAPSTAVSSPATSSPATSGAATSGAAALSAMSSHGSGAGSMTVMIRAEHLDVTTPGSHGAAALAARVTERLFLGDKVRYELELADGQTRLTAITGVARGRFEVGDVVEVAADPASVRIIPTTATEVAA